MHPNCTPKQAGPAYGCMIDIIPISKKKLYIQNIRHKKGILKWNEKITSQKWVLHKLFGNETCQIYK